jgi:hypothetical protein
MTVIHSQQHFEVLNESGDELDSNVILQPEIVSAVGLHPDVTRTESYDKAMASLANHNTEQVRDMLEG